ncbi:MAG: hypothetical protein M1514_03125, partial [Patescibacteria group bacterium]|nr:hypothetical protein [Patescibacteria group bacterium]
RYLLIDWYAKDEDTKKIILPQTIDEDLRNLFPIKENGQLIAIVLNAYRHQLSQVINYWTGVEKDTIESLITELRNRASAMKLRVEINRPEELFTNLSSFITTLVMNYLYTKNFTQL